MESIFGQVQLIMESKKRKYIGDVGETTAKTIMVFTFGYQKKLISLHSQILIKQILMFILETLQQTPMSRVSTWQK